MEYTRRAEVTIELDGITYRVEIVTDSGWGEWYEEGIYVDDSERNLRAHFEKRADGLYENIIQAVAMEVTELTHERVLA
jgi:hypothetical protein